MSWFKKSPLAAGEHPEEAFEHGVKILDVLAPDSIKLNMEARDKDEAIEELVDLLVQSGSLTNREAALTALYRREALASTGIGNGVAIPHGKDDSVPRLVAAFGISTRGIPFHGVDPQPAQVIFLLLARSNNPGPHIQALASIAELIQSPTFVKRVMAARNAAEVLDIIRTEE